MPPFFEAVFGRLSLKKCISTRKSDEGLLQSHVHMGTSVEARMHGYTGRPTAVLESRAERIGCC